MTGHAQPFGGGPRWRRLLAGLCLLTAALSWLLVGTSVPPLAAQTPAGSQPGDLYLALGDSITVGYGATAPGQRGFPAQLTVLINRLRTGRPAVLRNLAINGETSQSFIDGSQLGRAEEALRTARADGRRVEPLTVSLGGNDLLRVERSDQAGRRQALERFQQNLDRILDRLTLAVTADGQRSTRIVLLTIYNPFAGDASAVGSDAWWIEQFNEAIRAAARARGVSVVDLWSLFAGQESAWTRIAVGDIHPNNAGHLAIAEAVWRTLGYDRVAPAIEIVTPVPGDLGRLVPTVRVRATDAIGVARVELWVDARRVRELTWLPDHGLFVAPWDGRAAASGPHQLEIRAVDTAGNESRAGIEVRLR